MLVCACTHAVRLPGFARFISRRNPEYTDYVATRWYRAPELLLGSVHEKKITASYGSSRTHARGQPVLGGNRALCTPNAPSGPTHSHRAKHRANAVMAIRARPSRQS